MTKHCPYCGRFISHSVDLCKRCSNRFTLQIIIGVLSSLSFKNKERQIEQEKVVS